MPAEVLPFGLLGRPHGTTGEIGLRPFHSGGWHLDVGPLPLAVTIWGPDSDTPATITAVRRIGDRFLLRLEGVSTRERASSLTGRELWLPRTALPPLRAGEFYVEDLLGCLVENSGGRALGVVRKVFWNGAQDVILVGDEEQGERLLPAVPEFILAIDLLGRRVVVDPHE